MPIATEATHVGLRRRPLVPSLVLVLALALAAVPAGGAPPMLTEKWSLQLHSLSDSSPAIAEDGTIYLGCWNGDFRAVRPDGSLKWVFHAGREIKSSPAIGSDGTAYFGNRDRKLYAVGPDGREKWEFKTGAWVDSSPALGNDGSIYFGSWDNKFYALASNGSKKWEFQTGGPVVSSPTVGPDGGIYFGSHDKKFYALAANGQKSWEYCTGGAIISSPAVGAGGALYFSSVDGFFYSLDPNGKLQWRLKTGGITASSPVIGQDNTIYVGVNAALWAIRPDGTKAWEQVYGAGAIETTPLVLADGSVCFVSLQGLIVNLAAPNRFNWCFDQHWYAGVSPTADPGGTVYTVGHILGVGTFLYALPANVPAASSHWPKFRGNPRNTGNITAQTSHEIAGPFGRNK